MNLGLRIISQVVQEIDLIQVAGVAVAHHLAETHAPRRRRPNQQQRVAAALGDESHVARFSGEVRAVGHAHLRAVDAHAVGADHADPAAAGHPDQVGLERALVRQAGLGEACGVQVKPFHPLGHTVLDQTGSGVRRDDADNVVHRSGYVPQAPVDLQPADLVTLGVDRIDLARVAPVNQSVEEYLSVGIEGNGRGTGSSYGTIRGTDNRYGAGIEDGIE